MLLVVVLGSASLTPEVAPAAPAAPAAPPTAAPASTQPSDFSQALGPRDWSFPRDHGRHEGFRTEWWYFTGNLRDAGGRRFGYQLTFFRTALTPHPIPRPSPWAMTDLYFAHAAVTDVDGKRFTFKDRIQRGRSGLASASERTMDVYLLDWSAVLQGGGAPGGATGHRPGKVRLKAAEASFSIDLTCTTGRGPVLQGPGGLNAKGREPGQASYYYSMTRMATAGTLSVGGHSFRVTGMSWMDHEFSSNALSKQQVGWDWMGLQLADGSDLMIYRLRNAAGGSDYLSGTHVTADGKPHYLAADDISLASANPWKSPSTGAAYPQEWTVKCAGMHALTVRSLLPGQELITSGSTDVSYFEGAVEITDDRGKPAGEGYLEMTGYAKPLGGW